jgi:hypothetical protein
VVVLSRAQLSMLLEGIDWRMPAANLAARARRLKADQRQVQQFDVSGRAPAGCRRKVEMSSAVKS